MNVPQNFQNSVSTDRKAFVRYSQTLSSNPLEVRSGIIERYTYKTDSGELLPTIIHKNADTVREKHVNKRCGNRKRSEVMVAHCDALKTNFIHNYDRIQNKLTYSTNRVQTEHCDSTTDLEVPNRKRLFENRNFNDEMTTNETLLKKCGYIFQNNVDSKTQHEQINNDHSSYALPVQLRGNEDNESDSDCQIIESIEHDSQNDTPSLCRASASNISDTESVHVISDSDSDNEFPETQRSLIRHSSPSKDKQNNQNIYKFCHDKSTLQRNSKFISNPYTCNILKEPTAKHSKQEYNTDDDTSVYEIFNGITITLPSPNKVPNVTTPSSLDNNVVNNNSIISKKNLFDKFVLKTEIIEMLSKPSTSYLRSISQKPDTTTKSDDKRSQNSELNARKELTPTKSTQKYDYQLSPESMKSEFYSYLKINTNPLAQKEETVAQNRRSNRVKNLISQSEKLKEKMQKNDDTKNVEESKKKKLHDVRSKYLKYSQRPVVFPNPTAECRQIENFQETVEKYFVEEKMNQWKTAFDRKWNTECKILLTKNDVDRFSILKQAKILEKAQMKTPERLLYNNSIDLIKKREKILKTKNIIRKRMKYRNLRLSTNRVLRNPSRPVTRHALREHVFKKRQMKIKSKNFKLGNINKLKESKSLSLSNAQESIKEKGYTKTIVKKSSKNGTSSDSNQIPEINEVELSALDRFDIITQTYLAEHPLDHKYDREELSNSPLTVKKTETNNVLNNQNTEFSENKRKLSHSPHCMGFMPDDTIVKIRENLENILKSHLESSDNSTTETSESEDQTHTIENIEVAVPLHLDITSDSQNEKNSNEDDSEEQNSSKRLSVEQSDLFKSNMDILKNTNYIPLNPNIKMKSFHRFLLTANSKRKLCDPPSKSTLSFQTNSAFNFEYLDNESFSSKTAKTQIKRQTHEIDIDKTNGPVFNAYYVNCTLIIVQERLISFWKQTPLGNILGAQNMWLSIGNIQRITLERGCTNRRSSEMIFSLENSVAYVELWTKEHKSDFRERPIADVFATIYYHKGQGVPDKKVLQLENIKGYGNDVRFAVIKNSREIIVSWCDTFSKPMETMVRSYELASDFQTVSSIKEMESVSHYVSSLHNIGDCDTLVLGASNEQIFVWNLTHGWLVSTVSLTESSCQPPLSHSICLWAHCDNGFLFLLQQIGIGVLRLVAVNGMTNEWKQLQTYRVPECYLNLLGVTVESGILMTCYTNGFLCWDMQSGQLLADTDTPSDQIVLPSNKYLVSIDNFQVTVKHVMAYLLTND